MGLSMLRLFFSSWIFCLAIFGNESMDRAHCEDELERTQYALQHVYEKRESYRSHMIEHQRQSEKIVLDNAEYRADMARAEEFSCLMNETDEEIAVLEQRHEKLLRELSR